MDDGRISMQRLDESVVRILKAKAFTGLDHLRTGQVQNIVQDLNTDEAKN